MIVTLFYSITGGMLFWLATGKPDQIAWKYFRLVGILTLALVCGATGWICREIGFALTVDWRSVATVCGMAAGLGAAIVVVVAPLAANHPRVFRLVCGTAGLAGLVACGCAALAEMATPMVSASAKAHPTPVAMAMIALGQMLGALLLGSITLSWLLGHAYLTATKMTIAPLRHFSRLLSWSIVARSAFVLVSLAAASVLDRGSSPVVLVQLGQWWLIAGLRIGVGLVAVGAFAYMVADCVRLRSTQSATGILYFGSVMAYVGELASRQLVNELGWPI